MNRTKLTVSVIPQLFREKIMNFCKYLSIGLTAIMLSIGFYSAWQSVDLDQLLGMMFIAAVWLLVALLLLLFQVWKNYPEDRPNPFGTRYQKKMFWGTFILGPFFIIVLAARHPYRHYRESVYTPRKTYSKR